MRIRVSCEYVFYYKTDIFGERIEVCVKECKRPKLTKVYKELEERFNRGEIKGFGFDFKKD